MGETITAEQRESAERWYKEKFAEATSKLDSARGADLELSGIVTSLEKLAGKWGIFVGGDDHTSVGGVTKAAFKEGVRQALAGAVSALGAVRVIKAIHKSRVDAMRDADPVEWAANHGD